MLHTPALLLLAAIGKNERFYRFRLTVSCTTYGYILWDCVIHILIAGVLGVLSAYAAPATESRSELLGQKTNAKEERDNFDGEDEAVDNRRFRSVKISGMEKDKLFRGIKLSEDEKSMFTYKEDSKEDFEKRSQKKSRSSINVPYRWG